MGRSEDDGVVATLTVKQSGWGGGIELALTNLRRPLSYTQYMQEEEKGIFNTGFRPIEIKWGREAYRYDRNGNASKRLRNSFVHLHLKVDYYSLQRLRSR